MHSMSWTTRPGKAHPSPGQTTADVFQIKSLHGHRHMAINLLKKPSALAVDFSLENPLPGNDVSS